MDLIGFVPELGPWFQRIVGPGGSRAFPVPAVGFDAFDHGLEIEVSGQRHDRVVRRVLVPEVLVHLVAIEVGHGLAGSQHPMRGAGVPRSSARASSRTTPRTAGRRTSRSPRGSRASRPRSRSRAATGGGCRRGSLRPGRGTGEGRTRGTPTISAAWSRRCAGPMSSNPRSTSAAIRCSVPLNIMCSRKWLTPICMGCSSLAPVRTKNPIAVECGFRIDLGCDAQTVGRTCSRNVTGMGAGMASGVDGSVFRSRARPRASTRPSSGGRGSWRCPPRWPPVASRAPSRR